MKNSPQSVIFPIISRNHFTKLRTWRSFHLTLSLGEGREEASKFYELLNTICPVLMIFLHAECNQRSMKKYLSLFIVLLIYTASYAASTDTTAVKMRHGKPTKPPVCYLDLSTGINNPSGFLGVDFNICLSNYVTLDGGVGAGTWGNKLFVGAKYYLKAGDRAWAVGGGFSYSSGEENVNLNLNTVNGDKEKVSLSLKSQDDAFIAIYHYWTLGKKYNRFYVDAGKAVDLHTPRFHEDPGYPQLTSDAIQKVKRMAPGDFAGGIMVGLGFSFGLYRK